MDDSLKKCLAFIVEGDTEKEFYLSLLFFLCEKHGASFKRHVIAEEPDIVYMISNGSNNILVKFNRVGTITQIVHSGKWFESECIGKYKKKDWIVCLCYDKKDYEEDFSKFHKGDWEKLRAKLKKSTVIELAADADIEDVLLQDLEGVCRFLDCQVPQALCGRKGKSKMKLLFRNCGQAYHEGKRARVIIDSLDMQVIIDSEIIPLSELEHLLFD